MLLGLLVTSRVIRTLGADAWGVWGICLQALAYLGLVDLGIFSLLPRDVAFAQGRAPGVNDAPEVRATIASAWRMTTLQASIGCVAFNSMLWLGAPGWIPKGALLPLSIAGNIWLISLPLRSSTQVLVGLLDVDFLAISSALTSVTVALASLVAVLSGLGLTGLALVWGGGQVLSGTVCSVRLRLKHAGFFPDAREVMRARITWGHRSGWVFIGQISGLFLNASDNLLIGRALGPAAVTTYICTNRALIIGAGLSGAATQSAGPFLAAERASDHGRAGQAALGLLLLNLTVSGWLAACFVAANQAFIDIWVGSQFFGGHILTAVLAATFVITQFSGALVLIIFFFGNERIGTMTGIASGAIYMGLCPFLLSRLGPVAAPLVLGAAVGAIALPFLLWGAWRGTAGLGGYGHLLVDWFVRFLVLFLLAICLARYPIAHGLLRLVGGAIIITAVSILLFVGFAYRAPLRSLILQRFVEAKRGSLLSRAIVGFESVALSTHPWRAYWKTR